jgi:hypothetical protein
VKLGAAWDEVRDKGADARIRVTLEEPECIERAAALLAPLQPLLAGPGVLTFRVVGAPDAVKRLLERLDRERIHASLEVVSSDPIPVGTLAEDRPKLRWQWERALETIPADWSDLLAEVELDSSDWLDLTALNLAPINPRRDGTRIALRFRSASRFGYGGPPQMVGRCLERCDDKNVRGTVRILRVASDVRPVQTQGVVWQIDGNMV